MKLLNFGSLNIDHTYHLLNFVQPGETVSAQSYFRTAGGKALNQSVALARAGAQVFHAGRIGTDGKFLAELLAESGADISLIETVDLPTGHASIQVAASGENSIVIHGGANHAMDSAFIDKVLANFSTGDHILLQNEINNVAEIITKASAKGMKIIFNATPITEQLLSYPLELVDLLIVNELEAKTLAHLDLNDSIASEHLLAQISAAYPETEVLLTLGCRGAMFKSLDQEITAVPAVATTAVDTTAAGDTFIGYFLAQRLADADLSTAMATAAKAASISVQREGAAQSIPSLTEL